MVSPPPPDFQHPPTLLRRTIGEGVGLSFAAIWCSALLLLLHLRILLASNQNSAQVAKLAKHSPWLLVTFALLVAPVIEESLFRGIPFLILRAFSNNTYRDSWRQAPLYWPIGVIAAILFSLGHGLGDTSFHLPLPQLLVGLWSWHVITTRGIRYSFVLHSTYNSLPVLFMMAKIYARA